MGFVLQDESDGFRVSIDENALAGVSDLAGLVNAVAAVPAQYPFLAEDPKGPGLLFVREAEGEDSVRAMDLLDDLTEYSQSRDTPVYLERGNVHVGERQAEKPAAKQVRK